MNTVKRAPAVGRPMSEVRASELDGFGVSPDTEDGAKPVKKGKKSWKPASTLQVNLPQVEGYRLRFCNKDEANIAKKTIEGWIPINNVTGLSQVEHLEPGRVDDPSKLTTLQEYKELVLMALDEESAQARDEYYNNKTNRQMMTPKAGLRQQARDAGGERAAATVEGYVKQGRTVIE